ncbi:MAG: hypothetical protein KDD53_04375 [Bdellovibrionales bacterium]|nr:hypothetical protein [Bdellovibrionales bacterium]
MDTQKFRALSARDRALVAIAVLLDGHEAEHYLSNDSEKGVALSRAAQDLSSQSPELRMPFLGTMLRTAIEEL